MIARSILIAAALVAAGCTPGDGRQQAQAPQARAAAHDRATPAGAPGPGAQGRAGTARGFADLPDRGDLLAYPGKVVRHDGAYTWYRTDLSEEHALRAIAGGRLRVTTPEGDILDFQYDRHVEHASGDWTWIGHRPGHEGEQTILTFGAEAAFGSIARAGKPPLRLTVRDGAGWLVETDPDKLAGIANAATRPRRPDYRIVPESELPRRTAGAAAAADGASIRPVAPAATAMAATTTATTVDLVLGYTTGFANAHGGPSGATTRLNYLVDVANAAYGNSKVDAQVRLVKTVQVSYTDTNSNDTALEQLSGYRSGSGPVPPNTAFDGLRAARDQYGADLVSLVRDFRDPEQEGCGLAWLLGGGLQGIGPGEGWDELGYSVVGDGMDAGSDGKTYFCEDSTLAHELGHNMGAAHDRETAKGDDGVLDNPDDYGAYTYSFGYKAGAAAGNFYTIMAYGGSNQAGYLVFSNPAIKFCGGLYCGIANQADNARTFRQTMPVVAGFRASLTDGKAWPRVLLRQLDVDGNGRSDLLFFHHGANRLSFWLMSSASRAGLLLEGLSGAYSLVDAGDFNGDGRDDLLFTNSARQLLLGLGSGGDYTFQVLPYPYAAGTLPIGVADIDGNGRADILLRRADTGSVYVWYMSGATRVAYKTIRLASTLTFVGSADLSGDGRADLVWENPGRTIYVTIGNATLSSGLAHSASYRLEGVQDIDGNGRSDLLLFDPAASKLVVWYMNGRTRTAYNSHATPAGYRLMGKGDFDGNGYGDLVWQLPDTRQIRLMLSAVTGISTSAVAEVPDPYTRLMDID